MKTLSIHRLVQAVLQETLGHEEQRRWAEQVILVVSAAFPHAESTTWPQCERLLMHALIAFQLIEKYQFVCEEAARLLFETASYLRVYARYAEAEPLSQRALHIREQQFGPEHPEVVVLLDNLAFIYEEQGKYAEAEPLYQRALHIQEQQFGPESHLVSQPLIMLVIVYHGQGKYAEAEPLYQRALHILEQQLSSLHLLMVSPSIPVIVSFLSNALTFIYREQGKYEEAESLCQRALRIREQYLGSEHS